MLIDVTQFNHTLTICENNLPKCDKSWLHKSKAFAE